MQVRMGEGGHGQLRMLWAMLKPAQSRVGAKPALAGAKALHCLAFLQPRNAAARSWEQSRNTRRQRGLSSSACSTGGLLCAGRDRSQPGAPRLWPHLGSGCRGQRAGPWLGAAQLCWVVGTGGARWEQEVCGTATTKEEHDLGEGKKNTQLQKRPHPSAGMADAEVPWVSHSGGQILVLEERETSCGNTGALG